MTRCSHGICSMLPLWGDAFCWHRYTASMLCFGQRHPWCRAFTASIPRSCATVPALIVQLTFTSWSNLLCSRVSASAASPRSVFHGSQQPTIWPSSCRAGPLPTLCLLWPDGISLPRPVPALRRARFTAFAAHPIPPLRRGAIPCPLRSGSRSTRRLPSLATLVQQGDTVAHLRHPSARLSLRCTCNRDSRTVVVWYLIYPYITTPRTRQEEGRLQRSCIGLLPTGRGALGW